jgi:hypothetical protein
MFFKVMTEFCTAIEDSLEIDTNLEHPAHPADRVDRVDRSGSNLD